MSLVTQNINRLTHLLALFKLSKKELLDILNENKAKKLEEQDVFSDFIKISVLNKIDTIFKKGIAYYVNPSNPGNSPEESIFFRKDKFNATLNLSAKKIVNKYEEEKLKVDTLLKLSEIESDRVLPVFKTTDDPVNCAREIRKLIYPTEKAINSKNFLKNLIASLADKNVLVFEFVESFVQKEKANVNGFYLAPNVIVLKWQKYTKREIFTLAHEIGHYILKEEDIDERINPELLYDNLSEIEQWCNDFAFNFLIGEFGKTLQQLGVATEQNGFYEDLITDISANTHLSSLSIYTKLLYSNKISKYHYNSISDEVALAVKNRAIEEKRLLDIKKAEDKSAGKSTQIPPPKPIVSPLYLQTLQVALYNGFVDEYEFCQKLKIKSTNIDEYLV